MTSKTAYISLSLLAAFSLHAEDAKPVGKAVSFYEDIRPIFQARCNGCHQPAKAKGRYVMTDFGRLIKGGDSEEPAIVPGDVDKSYLVELISLDKDGNAEMPGKGKPLHETEIELVKKWIAAGAVDDTPDNVRQVFSQDNPPQYSLPPVITSIDFSPDGQLLAIAGFHEVLLHKADGSAPVARLVGLSERIESVQFSPDGKSLAVAGG
ncbi:MAG: c-type cytochrome domain-containing protein, partial [Opitutae bacterium]